MDHLSQLSVTEQALLLQIREQQVVPISELLSFDQSRPDQSLGEVTRLRELGLVEIFSGEHQLDPWNSSLALTDKGRKSARALP